jgi:GntR family transcriptional regulator, transcriptional repressor for pyruvate dehydrogenase complex
MVVKNKSFKPIKKNKRAFEVVALNIKESIFKGVWQPGERLPSENELSSQFGVSRHTIREALRTLELSGFLKIRTGVSGGPIVKDTIMTTISNLYLDAFQMENITVEEFTAARLAIEKVVINDAIDNATKEDIEKLKNNITKAKKLIANKEFATDANFEFHSLLACASKNKVFIILEKTINTINQKLRSLSSVNLEVTGEAVKMHEKLLDALIKKDREVVIQLLEAHLMTVGKSL